MEEFYDDMGYVYRGYRIHAWCPNFSICITAGQWHTTASWDPEPSSWNVKIDGKYELQEKGDIQRMFNCMRNKLI